MTFKSYGQNKTSKLVVSASKLTNIFAVLVRSGLGPKLAHGPPDGRRWLRESRMVFSEVWML